MAIKVVALHLFRCCVAAFLFVQFLQTLKKFRSKFVFACGIRVGGKIFRFGLKNSLSQCLPIRGIKNIFSKLCKFCPIFDI